MGQGEGEGGRWIPAEWDMVREGWQEFLGEYPGNGTRRGGRREWAAEVSKWIPGEWDKGWELSLIHI